MSKLTEKEFKKIYWKNFLSIEEEFIQTEKYVAFDTKNYTTYSTAFLKLLLEIGSEIDILAKVLCTEQWNKPNVSKIVIVFWQMLRNLSEYMSLATLGRKFLGMIGDKRRLNGGPHTTK